MKTKIELDGFICDGCGKGVTYATPCLRCGKDFCFDCRETAGRAYEHSVWACGSGDGFYCTPCDSALLKSGEDRRHNAYLAIQRLRAEAKAWDAYFAKRAEDAEANVERWRAGGAGA